MEVTPDHKDGVVQGHAADTNVIFHMTDSKKKRANPLKTDDLQKNRTKLIIRKDDKWVDSNSRLSLGNFVSIGRAILCTPVHNKNEAGQKRPRDVGNTS
jgi:hypothetical protein